MLLHILDRQALAMVLQAIGFALRVGAVIVAINLWPTFISEIYAMSSAIFYKIYLGLVFYLSRRGIDDQKS